MTDTIESPKPEFGAETPTPSDMQIVTREEARATGAKSYFLGTPCIHGHIARRSTINGCCNKCVSDRQRDSYLSDPEKHREYSRRNNRKLAENYKGRQSTEPKRCSTCKIVKPDSEFNNDRYTKDGRKTSCKSCVSMQYARWSETPNYDKRQEKGKATRRKLKEENPKRAWCVMAKNAAQQRSVKRGETSAITVEWLWENAPETCPLLGIPMNYGRNTMGFDSPAVDRIDNTKGYTPENCWVISSKANRIKTDATLEEIESVARNFRTFMDAREGR